MRTNFQNTFENAIWAGIEIQYSVLKVSHLEIFFNQFRYFIICTRIWRVANIWFFVFVLSNTILFLLFASTTIHVVLLKNWPSHLGAEVPNKHHRTNLHVRVQKSRNSALRFQSHKWVFRRKTHWLVHTRFLNRQCGSKPDNFVCRFMCVTLRLTPQWFSQNRSFAEHGVFESEIFEHFRLAARPNQSCIFPSR